MTAADLAPPPGGPTREPQQGRSRASYERMLSAAEKLLIKRGTDDFTLTDVSKLGKVSIGSIYCRFDSKDDLIRNVQARVMDRIQAEEAGLIDSVRAGADSLGALIPKLVDGYAENLKRNAPIMRPLMLRAATDPVVSGVGKQTHNSVSARFAACILDFREEIGHRDPERAALACHRAVFATIARHLGFGMIGEPTHEGVWEDVKADLADMCAAYLARKD